MMLHIFLLFDIQELSQWNKIVFSPLHWHLILPDRWWHWFCGQWNYNEWWRTYPADDDGKGEYDLYRGSPGTGMMSSQISSLYWKLKLLSISFGCTLKFTKEITKESSVGVSGWMKGQMCIELQFIYHLIK